MEKQWTTKLLGLRMLPFAIDSLKALTDIQRNCAEKTEAKGVSLTFWLHSKAI